MREISLNELSRWSPWPKRLLGLEQWSVPVRDSKKVEKEYNLDKYGALLKRFGDRQASVEEVRLAQFGDASQMCIAKGSQLYLCSLSEAVDMERQLVREVLRGCECESIVELGCGYGFNLAVASSLYPDKRVVGGDFSENAVNLGGHLGLDVRRFDFYSESSYEFLSTLPTPIVVFTFHSVEQIPDATENSKKSLPLLDKPRNSP